MSEVKEHEENAAMAETEEPSASNTEAGAARGPSERAGKVSNAMAGHGRAALALAVGLGAGLVLGSALSPREEAEARPPTVAAEARVRLSSELLERAGLQTATVQRTPMSAELALVGTVAFDPRRVADVGGRVSGRVARLHVAPGDWVEANAPLVEIESPELGDAVADLLAARARLAAANTHRTRAEGLSARDLATDAELETARASHVALVAEVEGAVQRLRALGLTDAELRSIERDRRGALRTVTLRAPIAGEIISLHSMLGQVVDPTHPILRIGDLSTVWVELEVYERDLSRVAVGDRAEIRAETHPDHPFEARIEHVGATVDPRTRTAAVRIAVSSPDRALRPGQFVHAFISSEERAREVLAVPVEAVVTVEGSPSVFVPDGDGSFEVRAVALGERQGALTEVVGGLAEGDEVVIAGVFALKSELLR